MGVTSGESSFYYFRRILGDAAGEMGPFANVTYGTQTRQIGLWYQDEAWFVNHNGPWFARGGTYVRGEGAGVFAFDPLTGHADNYATFRVALSF